MGFIKCEAALQQMLCFYFFAHIKGRCKLIQFYKQMAAYIFQVKDVDSKNSDNFPFFSSVRNKDYVVIVQHFWMS